MKKTITKFVFSSALAASFLSTALAGPYEDGVKAMNNMQDDKAFKILKPVADSGHAKAQNTVGFMYSVGIGVDTSDALATGYYRRAAEQGLVEAQANLARQYHMGYGVAQSYASAAYWYKKAAGQGDAKSAKLLKEINDEINAAQKPLRFSIYERSSKAAKPAPPPKLSTADPFMLKWKPNQSFPVFANTDFSDIGDAAASCFLVTINVLEDEVEIGKTSAEYARTKYTLQLLNIKLDSYERYYTKPKLNGGLSKPDVANAYQRHHDNAKIAEALKIPRGPTEGFCRSYFTRYVIDTIAAKTNIR